MFEYEIQEARGNELRQHAARVRLARAAARARRGTEEDVAAREAEERRSGGLTAAA
ncbi:hypothetical protein [Streptomyces abyssomicinicus]|uniref:hypothetical protein n=1 Tax=Streptomyces abyssomicinicus TaxID=574929 RepID=UPI0013DFCB83|nr:hypothetical protein [Streptomyces abyssomicinicus]